DTVNVPGAVDGWDQLLQRFGTKGFAETLEPAVRLCSDGFAVTERIHSQWAQSADLLRADPDSADVFLPEADVPPLYGVFTNPDLARTLRALQRAGRDAFYSGEIADAIVGKVHRCGGALSSADLAEFRSEWVDPLSVRYHGHDVHELPPNTQGFATLEMLNILDQC